MSSQPPVSSNAAPPPPAPPPNNAATNSRKSADFPGILGSEEDTDCKYIRVRPLGAGSFAEAWEVRRRSDGKPFAAKLMFIKSMDARAQKRAQSEVQCLQSCSHFACLSFVEHFVDSDNRILIIMEYCNAGDLAGYIAATRESGTPFPEATIAIIILQLILAIEHMHRRKIIHRDIKSQNVFLSTTGLVKVGDFGLSNEYDTISGDVANTFCGTPYYLAPEVWRRQRYGARADVWALGVLSYELITGRCPFTSSDMAGLAKRVEVPHHRINAARYGVSEELVDLIDVMLAKDPQRRPRAIHLLMHTPYLQRQLSTFVPTVNNTDRVSAEMKASIARCIEDVREAMAAQALRDEAERMRLQQQAIYEMTHHPNFIASPTMMCSSGNGAVPLTPLVGCGGGGDGVGGGSAFQQHIANNNNPNPSRSNSNNRSSNQPNYPPYPNYQQQQQMVNGRSLPMTNEQQVVFEQQQRAAAAQQQQQMFYQQQQQQMQGNINGNGYPVGPPMSPSACQQQQQQNQIQIQNQQQQLQQGRGCSSPNTNNNASDSLAFEGYVFKKKDRGFVRRYMVLRMGTLEVLEDETKPRQRRPLSLTAIKGVDICDEYSYRPPVDGSAAAAGGTDCFQIFTFEGQTYVFAAEDRDLWVRVLNEALGASDLQ